MSFLPVLVMGIILFIITILLSVADKLLVSYGTCTITVEQDGDKKTFDVEGGANLLTYLIEAGIEISSSCGGKGSCGYCKVQVPEGGGPILPTEEIFMSRQEKLRNMRLACQVKVKNDLLITIPNYLEVVSEMVAANKFDDSKRWLVKVH